MKELIIDAKKENLETVMEFVNSKINDCSMQLQTQISIAVEEIFINIANYAYNPEVGGVLIRITVEDDILIEFEDSGIPYNPLEKSDPNTQLSIEDRNVGGLGVFMVKKMMDTVEYFYENHKNILKIRKKIL